MSVAKMVTYTVTVAGQTIETTETELRSLYGSLANLFGIVDSAAHPKKTGVWHSTEGWEELVTAYKKGKIYVSKATIQQILNSLSADRFTSTLEMKKIMSMSLKTIQPAYNVILAFMSKKVIIGSYRPLSLKLKSIEHVPLELSPRIDGWDGSEEPNKSLRDDREKQIKQMREK